VKALNGINLDMMLGEILGVVGETGSGKSVTALSVLRLIPSPPGKIEEGEALFDIDEDQLARLEGLRSELRSTFKSLFGGSSPFVTSSITKDTLTKVQDALNATSAISSARKSNILAMVTELRDLLVRFDLLSKDESELRKIRGNNISMIFQEPMQALNPVFRIGDQIAESILLHRPKSLYRKVVLRMRKETVRAHVLKQLRRVFVGRADLPPGVDIKDPTPNDLRLVRDVLAADPTASGSIADLDELIGLEARTASERSQTSIFSRAVPKRIQSRMYATRWLRGGWQAPEVLDELRAFFSESPAGAGGIPWAHADILGPKSVALQAAPGGSAQSLAERLSELLDQPHPDAPSAFILSRVLERPRIEGNRVRVEIRPEFAAPRRSPLSWLVERIPLVKRTVLYPVRQQALDEAVKMLRLLKIPDPERIVNNFPHEMSGGMQQRALIAIALSCDPLLLIADEPTTALDVTIQAQILELLRELKRAGRPSILIITHDLGVIADMCDRVCVMYAGAIIENAPVKEIFKNPLHPYTQGLLKAIPSHAEKRERLEVIKGSVPNLIYPPSGCPFHPRCPKAMPHCGWDAKDLQDAVGNFLRNLKPATALPESYSSPSPTTLRVGFPDGAEGDRARSAVESWVQSDRASSVLLQAIRGVNRDGQDLVFTLAESKRPEYLEVSPRHAVACYLYEKAPEVL
jgi:oligopeptide/dipeptide ABC transporter ATP-binding protein